MTATAEKMREYRQRWKAKNPDYGKMWATANREKMAAYYEKWCANNPIKLKESRRAERQRNKTKKAEYREMWRAKNREKTRSYVRNRRARIVGAVGSHGPADIEAIRGMQRGRCAYCRTEMGDRLSVDHIIPLSRGGHNDKANLQLLCGSCNSMKHDSMPENFARSLGRLI